MKAALAVFSVMIAMVSLNAQAGERITMKQAEAIALKAYPGTIVEASRKQGKGGMRYAFDIRSHHKTRELAIDASTGKVIRNSPETEDDDD
ncbi:MAG TPA: PepSY domain-containing protein [Burkholderiales bacterium]|nr:PepSY domain-containing protein [Burkholderiales bacterium]